MSIAVLRLLALAASLPGKFVDVLVDVSVDVVVDGGLDVDLYLDLCATFDGQSILRCWEWGRQWRWSAGNIALDAMVCLPTLGLGCYLAALNAKVHESQYTVLLEPVEPAAPGPDPAR